MKKILILFATVLLTSSMFSQDKLYLVFEMMRVDNEQENAYWETETFWEKIHEQRALSGEILGWDLWALSPGGEDQGYQYMTVTLFSNPANMFKGTNFMKHATNAYPHMEEDEIVKIVNNSSSTRDLAVRLFLEEIARTEGVSEMPLGTIAYLDFMKANMNDYEAYEKAEMKIFQPMHQKQVDAGTKNFWSLMRVMLPYGSDTYSSHITVNMFTDIDHVFKSDNWDYPKLSDAQQKAIDEGLALRDFKLSNMARLIKKVRPE